MRRVLYILPVLVFVAIAGFLAQGLTRDPSELPSALLDQPAPEFDLPPLPGRDEHGFARSDLGGEPMLVNVFASWCVPCRIEHPLINRLAEDGVTVHGLNHKDKPEDATAWLDELGDNFTHVGSDQDGRAAIEWGVYGVPETFVITGDGAIAYKHVGPIQMSDLEDRILPALRAAGWDG